MKDSHRVEKLREAFDREERARKRAEEKTIRLSKELQASKTELTKRSESTQRAHVAYSRAFHEKWGSGRAG